MMSVALLASITMSFAQEQITKLDEIQIIASPIQKFGVGTTITAIDSSVIANYKQLSLAIILSSQSSIYIKQYGAGMLASVSFRGTGAGHTVVRWNGVQVGYPSLGQSDFSLIPMDFIDEVNLVHGSSSARFGTGAIGGVVDLKSFSPTKGLNININQSFGSFGTSNSTLQLSTAGKKGYLKIGGVYKKSQNNFPYRSASNKELGKQENADYSINGVQVDAGYLISEKNSLKVNLQSTYANRNIQPSLGGTASNNQQDRNFWSSIAYQHALKSGVVNVQYAYLYDKINYNGSVSYSEQNNVSAVVENDLSNNISTEIGVNSNWVKVVTPNYDSNNATENRADIYASLLWKIANRFTTTINLRQAFVTGYNIPFTPSIGVEYKAIKSDRWNVKFVSQVAKGYKVPTLNDRYWVPGGNPSLKPEESVSVEVGGLLKHNGLPFWLNTTVYQMWVDNWILWLPNGSIWSPENKRKVKGFGIEVETGAEKTVGDANLKGWVNYAYTKSTNQEPLDQYDRSAGKQLPYVPYHNGNITGQIHVKQWLFQINTVFTGKRFITSDNETEVAGYGLLNALVKYHLLTNPWQMDVYLQANNITNTNYQSITNKAMPGINFLVGAKINFNK